MAAEMRLITPSDLVEGISSGGMTRSDAISASICGASGIYTTLTRIFPGAEGSPHVHLNCESSIYVVAGRGCMRTGDRLARELPLEPGVFLFVPPGAPHQPVNDGGEDLVMVVSRNTPEEVVEDYTP